MVWHPILCIDAPIRWVEACHENEIHGLRPGDQSDSGQSQLLPSRAQQLAIVCVVTGRETGEGLVCQVVAEAEVKPDADT